MGRASYSSQGRQRCPYCIGIWLQKEEFTI